MLLSTDVVSRKSSRWVFTHNNPADGDAERILAFFRSDCRYGVFGVEVGSGGTPHLQGFFILSATGSRTLAWVRSHFPVGNPHFECARGTSAQASAYCKKEGSFVEHGELGEPGRRTDLHDAFEWGREFLRAHGRAPTSPEIVRSGHFGVYVKNARFRPALMKLVEVRRRLDGEFLRDWQVDLEKELLEEPGDRKIVFVVDSVGNSGKSFFCRWFLENHGAKTQVLSAGKEVDLSYMVEDFKSIFLFDISRGRLEYLQYSILEALKNGVVQSTKYASMSKILHGRAHVVVFTNEHPDMTKLSEDRYDIREI